LKILKKILSFPFIILIQFYRYAISPLTPASCRHIPTCSEYAVKSIKMFGPIKGVALATKRLSKCHPWGTHGYDPIPKIIIKKYKTKSKLKMNLHKNH
jgi:putative membrane protein insertion efficiency factor